MSQSKPTIRKSVDADPPTSFPSEGQPDALTLVEVAKGVAPPSEKTPPIPESRASLSGRRQSASVELSTLPATEKKTVH